MDKMLRHTMKPMQVRRWLTLLLLIGVVSTGCQTLREVTNLRKVQFRIDRVADAQLAGVSLDRVQSYEDLRAADILQLTRAATSGDMPLAFTIMVEAENPPDNSVQARLVDMDWTLLLDDTETIQGRLEENVTLPPGEPALIPVPIELDLVRFFGNNARDLIELALAVAGEGDPKTVTLRVRPSVDTLLGPMRYPESITVVRRDVGGNDAPGTK